MTAKKFNQIYANWCDTGELPQGYRLAGDPEWRNPTRKDAKADWRSGDPTEARDTALRRLLPATYFRETNITRVRSQ